MHSCRCLGAGVWQLCWQGRGQQGQWTPHSAAPAAASTARAGGISGRCRGPHSGPIGGPRLASPAAQTVHGLRARSADQGHGRASTAARTAWRRVLKSGICRGPAACSAALSRSLSRKASRRDAFQSLLARGFSLGASSGSDSRTPSHTPHTPRLCRLTLCCWRPMAQIVPYPCFSYLSMRMHCMQVLQIHPPVWGNPVHESNVLRSIVVESFGRLPVSLLVRGLDCLCFWHS